MTIAPTTAERTTPLAKDGVYTSDALPSRRSEVATVITGTVFADKAGTLFVEQGPDGEHWDLSESQEIAAGEGAGFYRPVVGRFWRLRYVNGGAAQGAFRVCAQERAGD